MSATALPYWTTNLVPVAAYPSYPDGSADFSAGGGFLSLASGLPLSAGNGFTVVWWMVQDQLPAADNEIVWAQLKDETGVGQAGNQVRFAFETSLGIYRGVVGASNGSFASTGDAGVFNGVWQMVALLYDPSTFPPNPTVRSSKNGLPFGSSTTMTALLMSAQPATEFWVGNGPAAAAFSHFRGRVDALSVWDGPLTLAEVQTLYHGGLGYDLPSQVPAGSIAPPLIAWYPFDEPSGAAVWQDASGNARHLSATGNVVHGGPRNT